MRDPVYALVFYYIFIKKLQWQWKARGRELIWLLGCGIDKNFMCICQCKSSGYLFVRDVRLCSCHIL